MNTTSPKATAAHPNGSETRPEGDARRVGKKKRQRFTKALDTDAPLHLGLPSYFGPLKTIRETSPDWVVGRIRPEVMAVLSALQKKHMAATGKEISKAEVLSALTLAGLPAVLKHCDFSGTA